MAGIDLLERAWLELAATNLPTRAPRPEYRLDGDLPPCALCGWPDAMALGRFHTVSTPARRG